MGSKGPKMQTITFLNEKGGVGKTTLSREAALILSQMGFRVVVIDADGQGDLTRSLGLLKAPHFNDFCRRENVPLKSLIQRVPQDVTPHNLYLIAGNAETWGIAGSSRTADLVGLMKTRMTQLASAFDYCIFDTQPSPTQLHDAVSLVSRWMIFPTDPEFFSSGPDGGLESSFNNTLFNREQALQRGFNVAEPLAIVPNRYRSRTIIHQQVVEYLHNKYGALVWEPIPLRTAISEAQLSTDSLTLEASYLDTSEVLRRFAERIAAMTKDAQHEQA